MTKTFAVQQWRYDFPILQQQVHGKPLIYLDNAATTQKPKTVIDKISYFYNHDNSNVHRGIHTLSARATTAFEATREKVQQFINAKNLQEIIFTSGTTAAINLVAQSFARIQCQAGDEIIISAMEHHSNIVPWQMVCEQTGAKLRVVPMNDAGELMLDQYKKLLNPRTKLVAIVHVSNALGTINPVKEMIDLAHQQNVPVLIDGAQAVAHMPVDVQALNCDFYVFSSHKLFGPTGVGVLYGKKTLLEEMPPNQGGGDMIKLVTFEKTIYNDLPFKFEAGTPNIADIIGLGAAIDYINAIGLKNIEAYETELFNYATQQLQQVAGLRMIGTARAKANILSFVLEKIHAHDIGTILDHQGIAIRSGHHCAMPVMEFFKVPATARASIAFYNTHAEIDALVAALRQVKEVFA